MNPQEIIAALSKPKGLPRAALAAANEQRETLAPLFIAEIERYIGADGAGRAEPDGLFFMFHLLGEWRETKAFPTLARFLRLPDEEMDRILDDAVTCTTHRVMTVVFDGDPQPLYDIILDPRANEFIRSRMIETLAMLVAGGRMERAQVVDFLGKCFSSLQPQGECFVWDGWQNAIAMLGLEELRPQVKEAFARELIDPEICDYSWFESRLAEALAGEPYAQLADEEYAPFGNTAEEFAKWHGFSDAYRKDLERMKREAARGLDFLAPQVNHHRDVGRNDPCPCGSGQKFKKCCLAAQSKPFDGTMAA
jgi:hypothetical protein